MRKVPPGSSRTLARLVAALRRTFMYWLLAFVSGRRVIVRGPSMYPLLAPGDRVLVDRLAYVGRLPERGDVVLAVLPSQTPSLMLKLVLGLPGETMEISADRVWIDGACFFLPSRPLVAPPGRSQLGQDECFLLSYNPSMGTDSRHFGPVPLAALRGRAWWLFWPPARRRWLEPELPGQQQIVRAEGASTATDLR